MEPDDLCVIFNPAAGKNRAGQRLEKLRQTWGSRVTLRPTTQAGDAVELARQAALEGFPIVAAAGGDGTVHEVANGLLRAQRPDARLGILPIGSANDYAFSVAAHAAERRARLGEPPAQPAWDALDVGRVRGSGGREKFFVCCLGLGLNGVVTQESRRIQWLQGMALYGLATLRALWRHDGCPAMTIELDDGAAWQTNTLMFSTLVGKREGGFVMAPRAELDDGWFDFVHAGNLSRWQVLKLLPRLALYGPPDHHPQVRQGRCRRVHLTCAAPLSVHVDGELFCTPEDRVFELEIDLLSQALRVEIMEI